MSKVDINSHCGSGRIGKDIVLRHTQGGKSVCDVSVAMNVGYGERQKTVWTKLTIWGKQAEFITQYGHKGDSIMWAGAQYNVDEFDGSKGDKVKTHYFEIGMGGQVNLMSKAQGNPDRDSSPEEDRGSRNDVSEPGQPEDEERGWA